MTFELELRYKLDREDDKEQFRCNNVDEAKVFVKVVNELIREIQSKI